MAFNRTPAWLTLAATIFVAAHASALETLPGEPPVQLFLDGGTRIFHVGDPTSLKGLGPGDKVRFEVERDGRSYTITRLVNSN
jgi:Cu/Ag efflux protein CusF